MVQGGGERKLGHFWILDRFFPPKGGFSKGNQNISGKLGGGFNFFFHLENWGNDPI